MTEKLTIQQKIDNIDSITNNLEDMILAFEDFIAGRPTFLDFEIKRFSKNNSYTYTNENKDFLTKLFFLNALRMIRDKVKKYKKETIKNA
jgi:hypothetical protein